MKFQLTIRKLGLFKLFGTFYYIKKYYFIYYTDLPHYTTFHFENVHKIVTNL